MFYLGINKMLSLICKSLSKCLKPTVSVTLSPVVSMNRLIGSKKLILHEDLSESETKLKEAVKLLKKTKNMYIMYVKVRHKEVAAENPGMHAELNNLTCI
jgi:hypothetical protein